VKWVLLPYDLYFSSSSLQPAIVNSDNGGDVDEPIEEELFYNFVVVSYF
jgi:hypothetical protein